MNNTSGIEPQEYKVLIKPDDAVAEILKKYTALAKAGFKVDDTSRDREQHAATEGVLIATSPLAWSFADYPSNGGKFPEIGDHVIFPRYVGFMVKGNDGEDYWLLNDKDIIAVRNGA